MRRASGVDVAAAAVVVDGPWVTYWWPKPAGAGSLFFALGTGASSVTQVDVDALVYSYGIPQDSVVAIEVPGSARTTGRIVLSRPGLSMTYCLAFTDPQMAGGRYSPSNADSWQYAPAGTYAYWMDPRVGVVEVTVTDASGNAQTMVTENMTGLGGVGTPAPVGELTLGGRRDGLVGPLTFAVRVDGLDSSAPTGGRLFRKDADTSLTAISKSAVEYVIESPSLDYPFGGVWADDDGALGQCVSWEDPTFAPGWTYLHVEAHQSDTDPVTAVAAFYPRHLTHPTL